jgi:cyclin B
MQKQVDITPKMRCILVDWLIEVHHKFKLREPTLWLAINIMDRYLENNFPQRAKLQLVGISAFFIACKFEEVYPPEIRECIYITDYAYEKDELLEMEKNILTALGFDIFVPTGYCFLQRYCNCIQASDRVKALASYYAERNLQESDMLQLPPHVFAAGALYAALKQQVTQYSTLLKDHKIWTRPLIEESGLRESDVIPAARQIIGHVRECPETASKRKLMAARKKFSAEKYFNVSSYTIPFIPDA